MGNLSFWKFWILCQAHSPYLFGQIPHFEKNLCGGTLNVKWQKEEKEWWFWWWQGSDEDEKDDEDERDDEDEEDVSSADEGELPVHSRLPPAET